MKVFKAYRVKGQKISSPAPEVTVYPLLCEGSLKTEYLPADNELCVRASPDVRHDHHYDASDSR